MATILRYDGIYYGQKGLPILGSADNNRFYLGTGNLKDLDESCFVISTHIDTRDDALYVDGDIIPNDRMVIVCIDYDPKGGEDYELAKVSYQGKLHLINSIYFDFGFIQECAEETSMQYGYADDDPELTYHILIKVGDENTLMKHIITAKFISVFQEMRQTLFGHTKLKDTWNKFTSKVRSYLQQLNPRYDDLIETAWERLPAKVKIFYNNFSPDLEMMLMVKGIEDFVSQVYSNPDEIFVLEITNPGPGEILHAADVVGVFTPDNMNTTREQSLIKIIAVLDTIANSNPYPDFDMKALLQQHQQDVKDKEQ